ncbi:MAG: hypothetical protein HFI34_09090 [Lachnospiraceae bacterium]|nr:hypothetical protein [Lachnospiraceae bacterium]
MNKDIAIVGMACRFPKAKNKKMFWDNLVNGVDAVDVIPKERWDALKIYSADIMEQGKTYCKWLGALEDIDKFDNNFFNISPREAENMDPCQRLLLQEAWHCIEDSSISYEEIKDKITSVHVGSVAYEPYKTEKTDISTANGTYYFMLANKISYYMDLKGGSFTLDTGCSSSFVALKTACQALIEESSDYAFVGGVNLHLSSNKLTTWSKSRMFSETGKCHTFDKDADGYVPGEGVAVILLQPLEKAVEANSKIYAVIKGCAINHGGHALSLTAPSVEAQKEVIHNAYLQTDFMPNEVSYVETHGTGTSLGDPIEVEALTQLFREYTDEKQFCTIGSVKANIGHLEGCAAMASLIKVVLMLNNKFIPKSLHLNTINPILEMKDSPFKLVTESTEWKRLNKDQPLRAGISSFGLGGTNAHVLLEEYMEEKDVRDEVCSNSNEVSYYFLLSAKSENSLIKTKNEWSANINEICKNEISDISFTLMNGRKQFQYRIGGLVKNKEDIIKLLANKGNICDTKSKKQIISVIGKGDFEEVYDLYKGLEKIGLKSDVITSENEGICVALVISGIISIEDMRAYINGKKTIKEIKIGCPSIPFYDWSNNRLYKRINISKMQLRKLFDGISLDSKQCNEFIEKAKILYKFQHTFKKYADEWNLYIEEYGIFESLLEESITENVTTGTPKKLILMIIILNSLDRLNVKWSLSRQRNFENREIYELLNMLTEDIITKEDCIGIILRNMNEEKYSEVIINCNSNFNKKTLKNQYEILSGENNISSYEIEKLIKENIDSKCKMKCLPDQYTLFTINSSLLDKENRKEFVIELWKKGLNINWNSLIDEKHYKRVDLPKYCFDENKYWNNQISNDTLIESTSKEWIAEAVKEELNQEYNCSIIVFFHDNEQDIQLKFNKKYINSQIYYIKIDSGNSQQIIQRKLMFTDNVSMVYYFTTMKFDLNGKYTVTDFISIHEKEYIELLNIIKLLHICGYSEKKIDFKIITNNVNQIDKSECCSFINYGINGLAKSIMKEFDKWNVKLYDLDLNDTLSNNFDLLLRENDNEKCQEVAYRKGKRYIKEVMQMDELIFNECNKDEEVSLIKTLCETLGEILYIQKEDISMDDSFLDMGMDSITELEMIKALNKKLNIKLTPMDLFAYDNVYDLADYIRMEF